MITNDSIERYNDSRATIERPFGFGSPILFAVLLTYSDLEKSCVFPEAVLDSCRGE